MPDSKFKKYSINAFVLTATMFQFGCSNSMSDLQDFVEKTKATPPGEIPPIPEIIAYNAFEYPGHDRDPFDPDIMAAAITPTALQSKNTIAIDTNRTKEYLESFPLDSLKMVGTLTASWRVIMPDRILARSHRSRKTKSSLLKLFRMDLVDIWKGRPPWRSAKKSDLGKNYATT
jgi:hypothetical protein